MRQRLFLCLLLIGAMLYYAVPRLNFKGATEEQIFAAAWLLFAIFAVAGNVATLLFADRRKKVKQVTKKESNRKRAYNY